MSDAKHAGDGLKDTTEAKEAVFKASGESDVGDGYFRSLLAGVTTVDFTCYWSDGKLWTTPLARAAIAGNVELCQILVHDFKANVNFTSGGQVPYRIVRHCSSVV